VSYIFGPDKFSPKRMPGHPYHWTTGEEEGRRRPEDFTLDKQFYRLREHTK